MAPIRSSAILGDGDLQRAVAFTELGGDYLDRNYGGILIIWDRIFGTFTEEKQRPTYGLTYPVETYNLLKLQYGDYVQMWRDVRSVSRLRDKLGYVFGPPGYRHDGPAQTADALRDELRSRGVADRGRLPSIDHGLSDADVERLAVPDRAVLVRQLGARSDDLRRAGERRDDLLGRLVDGLFGGA